jgi:hypothetical protein
MSHFHLKWFRWSLAFVQRRSQLMDVRHSSLTCVPELRQIVGRDHMRISPRYSLYRIARETSNWKKTDELRKWRSIPNVQVYHRGYRMTRKTSNDRKHIECPPRRFIFLTEQHLTTKAVKWYIWEHNEPGRWNCILHLPVGKSSILRLGQPGYKWRDVIQNRRWFTRFLATTEVIRTMPHFTINHWTFQNWRRFGHLCLIHRQLGFRISDDVIVNHKLQWTRIGPLMIVNGNTRSMPFIANQVVGIMKGVGNWQSCRTGIAASRFPGHRWILDCRFSEVSLFVRWNIKLTGR